MANDSYEYFQSLGEFIQAYALCEQNMQLVLGHYSGLSFGIAQAVFGGTRISQGIDCVRRIQEAQNEEVDSDLSRAFAHLNLVTKIRNDVVHHGTQLDENEERTVSNWFWAHHPKAHKVRPVSVNVLRQLTQDCLTISGTLMFHGSFKRHEQAKDYRELGLHPWLYTPPQPRSKRSKNFSDIQTTRST